VWIRVHLLHRVGPGGSQRASKPYLGAKYSGRPSDQPCNPLLLSSTGARTQANYTSTHRGCLSRIKSAPSYACPCSDHNSESFFSEQTNCPLKSSCTLHARQGILLPSKISLEMCVCTLHVSRVSCCRTKLLLKHMHTSC